LTESESGPDPLGEKENGGQRDADRRPDGCRIGGFQGQQQAEFGDKIIDAGDNSDRSKPCRKNI
jgi:hypothetical protein